jgi:hypothetical protein
VALLYKYVLEPNKARKDEERTILQSAVVALNILVIAS